MSESPHPILLLASASPRRRELLQQIGVEFAIVSHAVDETPEPDERPHDYVRRMARGKACCDTVNASPRDVVLGADTAVVMDGRILGKPLDDIDAVETLLSLSGRTHQVCSAVSLRAGSLCQTRLSVTEVTFRPVSRREAEAYWATGEPADKAGAYGIQGIGALFVARIEGSYSGVVGLPLHETASLLDEFGVATALGCGPGHE